jgi:hypothetical protein
MNKRNAVIVAALVALLTLMVLTAILAWRELAIDDCLDRGGRWDHGAGRCETSIDEPAASAPAARDESRGSAMTVDVVFDAPPPLPLPPDAGVSRDAQRTPSR